MLPGGTEEFINDGPEGEAAPEKAESGETTDAEKKAAEYLAAWQRAQADFINYKRRSEQERQEFNSFANASLIRAILPVLDDLELALDHVPEEHAGTDWVKGVKLVERKFKTILEGQGVKPILALGMAFDPRIHEALRQDEGEEGVVIGELQKGYTLNDKLLRPARVVVGKGKAADNKEEKENG
ncbi:MAG: nucleotide exchange factor GrpE [Chloroflexi bacterium RBG_13_57_8]|nr:MAG: nucleotide exchange factor GrpE [Chloroflexi bacterium RBG_13_57_8]